MANGFASAESTRAPIILPKEKPQPTIGPDPRGWRQRKADEFYHSGHPAAGVLAALDDILPGIPFKNIIPDPPNKLIGKAEGVQPQNIRDLMNVVDLAMLAGSLPTLAKKGVGRVATNLFEPVSYTHKVRSMLEQLQHSKGNLSTILERLILNQEVKNFGGGDRYKLFGGLKGDAYKTYRDKAILDPNKYPPKPVNILEGLPYKRHHPSLLKEVYGAGKRALKHIKSDVPIYVGKGPDDMYTGRELPYRKMFGLEPRFGKDVYIKNPDGSYRFNPADKYGEQSLKEIKRDAISGPRFAGGSMGHPVMGGYSLKPYGKQFEPGRWIETPKGYEYKDVWDFALNDPSRKLDRTRIIRALMNKLADPITIKGKIPKPKDTWEIEDIPF